MLYDVFRIMEGTGNVDFCGVVQAVSPAEAENYARLMYPAGPGERIEVQETPADEAARMLGQ